MRIGASQPPPVTLSERRSESGIGHKKIGLIFQEIFTIILSFSAFSMDALAYPSTAIRGALPCLDAIEAPQQWAHALDVGPASKRGRGYSTAVRASWHSPQSMVRAFTLGSPYRFLVHWLRS